MSAALFLSDMAVDRKGGLVSVRAPPSCLDNRAGGSGAHHVDASRSRYGCASPKGVLLVSVLDATQTRTACLVHVL